MAAPLDPDLVRAIRDRLREGSRRLDIAADLGISQSTVNRVATAHGWNRRRPRAHHKSRVIRPNTSLDWMLSARCADMPDFTEQHIEEQKRFCSGCDVKWQCLEYGLEGPVAWSKARPWEGVVFGGLAPMELARLKRERSGLGVAS